MRPSIVEFLQEHGLSSLTALVPSRTVIYLLAMAAVVHLFFQRSKRAGLSLDLTLPLAAVAASLYLRLKGIRPWSAMDAAGSSVMLAIAIARFGCFLDGCDFGRITSLPWGVHYPRGSLAFRAHVTDGVLTPAATRSLMVHPLPLYLALNALVLFLILSLVWRRSAHRPGLTFALTWAFYGGARFFLEFLRDPAAGGAVSGLSALQWTALGAVGFGASLAYAASRWETTPAPDSLPTTVS